MGDRTVVEKRMTSEQTRPRTKRKMKWILLAVCLLVLALIGWFTGAIGSRRPVTILRDNASFENAVSRILNKLPSGPRDSLRKLKFWLLGPPTMVSLDAKILSYYDVPATVAETLELGPPAPTADGGLQIWIVPNQQIVMYRRAQILSSPRMMTFNGHQAQMAMTTSTTVGPNGYMIDLLPRVRNEVAELSIRVNYLQAPATNTLLTARLNLPKDKAALILRPDPANSSNTFGIFLQPALQTKK